MKYDPISAEYKYKAFISYRHAPRDMAAAKALHKQIERYTIPTGRKNAESRSRKKWKVFRDEEELRITNDLPQSIHDALDASEYLIVICSPESMDSLWVPLEIAYFLRNHDQEHILTVVTAGDPGQMLPDLLVRVSAEGYDTSRMNEPLYMDIRADNSRSMKRLLKERFLKLAATLHGCAYDDLVMREQRRRRTQFLQRLAIVVCFFASIIAVLLWSNHQITGKNQELEQKNEQLQQQQQEILLRESEVLTAQSLDALSEGDHFSAIKNAVSALPAFEGERPYHAPAEQALIASMRLLNNPSNKHYFSKATIPLKVPIQDYCLTSGGNAVAYLDQSGSVYLYDIQVDRIVWKKSFPEENESRNGSIMYCSQTDSILVSFLRGEIISISCSSGDINWCFEDSYLLLFRPLLSLDQQYIVAHGQDRVYDESLDIYTDQEYLLRISTETGELLQSLNLSVQLEVEAYWFEYTYNGTDIADCISADGTTYVGFYLAEDAIEYYAVDFTDGTTEVILCTPIDDYEFSYPFFINEDSQFIAIQASMNTEIPVNIIKFDLDTEEVLWSAEFPPLPEPVFHYSDELYYAVSGNSLAIVRHNTFEVFDLHSGEMTVSYQFENFAEHLFLLGADSYGVIFHDGTFAAVDVPNDELISIDTVCSLGIAIDNLLYTGSITYIGQNLNGAAVETVFEPNGDMLIAAVDINNVFEIQINREIPINDTLAPKLVQTLESIDDPWHAQVFSINDQYTVLGPMRSFNGDEYAYYYSVLAAESFLPVYHIDIAESDDPIYFLPDGEGYVLYGELNDYSGKAIHDPDTLDRYSNKVTTVDGSPMYAYQSDSDNLTKIWYDGTEYPLAPMPEDFLYDEWNDALGNNGYYVYTAFDIFPKERIYFAVYDFWDSEWFRIPTDHTYESFYPGYFNQEPFCIGNVSPLMAFWTSQGNLRIYSCDDGQLVNEFLVDIPIASLINMEFVAEDAYLMLQTDESLLLILDVTSGTIVYREILCFDRYYNFIWTPYYDPQDHRLFIRGVLTNDSICLDTNTWTKMASIPGMIGYDSETNLVYQATVDPETAENRITASYFPPADELIEIARELVGIDER